MTATGKASETVQQLILHQLQRVNTRLDSVEEWMNQVDQGARRKDTTKLSKVNGKTKIPKLRVFLM